MDSDIRHFVDVMGRVTDTGTPPDATMTAAEADEMVAGCALLTRLRKDIADGPLSAVDQFWIGTGKPSHVPPG